MKKIIFILMFLIVSCAHARNITLNIPDEEIAIIENDVLDAEQWLMDAWNGKVNNCKSRIIKAEIDRSIKDNETLPAGEAAIIEKFLTRPDYKNRKDREAEKD